ncbi:MAG TPA: hypothetical protein VFD82_00880 [Planctomycetota bacterium]|nr:hypothetical protein [Planctomycetota bacterium]
MSIVTRRFARVLVLVLVGACLSACHFHPNGCFGWGYHHHHCAPVYHHCR